MGKWNWPILTAVVLSLITWLSWPIFFVRWPATRDVPWVNLLLLMASVAALLSGLRRGFASGARRPLRIVWSSALAAASMVMLANFVMMVLVNPRRLPASSGAPSVGAKAPDFTLKDASGRLLSLGELLQQPVPPAGAVANTARPPRGVLLVFYMYSGCRGCNSEFRGLQQHLAELSDSGIRPVAISIDPPEVSRRLSEEAGYTFTFLSDPTLEVIRRYDVAKTDGEARPAEFLIDASGTVRWRNLTANYYVRAKPEQILAAASRLQ